MALTNVLESLVASGWLDRGSSRYVVRDPAVINVLERSLPPARRATLRAALAPDIND